MKFKFLGIVFLLSGIFGSAQDTLTLNNTDAILYKSAKQNGLLVVGLGGSEGGNAWASNYWKKVRDQFIDEGYSFLAVGYFKTKNSPKELDRIGIDDIYAMISEAKKKSNSSKTAIVGGSRGADLALLLASYYSDINCVVGLSSSHVVFPGNTTHFLTSSWTYQGEELPFVPVNDASVPFIMSGDLRGAFSSMLQDKVAADKAAIKVEKIKGSVLLLSGTKDEICPSSEMSDEMIERLKENSFAYPYEHVKYEGGHGEPLKHFDKVFEFLKTNFRVN